MIKRALSFIPFLFLLFAGQAQAQTAVTLALGPHPQFLDGTGKVLAGGFLYTYQAGTNTPEPTYADNLGTIQNPNPILLDATGAPSNNSGAQIQVWFLNASYKLCVQNSSLVQQWCSDNFSGFSILNNIQNITLNPVTSDPSGSAGELGYRSDLGCFRGYSVFWDCLITATGIQTLSNKTLTAPIINGAVGSTFTSPQITGLTLGGIVDATHNPTNFANFTNGAAGTTVNLLAKLVVSGSGVNAVTATTSDMNGVEGIVIAGAGTSGLDLIQRTGQVNCTFDGSTTANDYVQISSTVNGNCHDTGSTSYPTSGGDVIGRVLTTNVAGGNYLIDLFGPEVSTLNSVPVHKVDLTAQAANIGPTPIFTPSASGFFRVSFYLVTTQAASVSSTSPNASILYTDADSNTPENFAAIATNTNNGAGVVSGCQASGGTFCGMQIFAKSGVAIQYAVTNYASSGATPMQFALHIRIEGPF